MLGYPPAQSFPPRALARHALKVFLATAAAAALRSRRPACPSQPGIPKRSSRPTTCLRLHLLPPCSNWTPPTSSRAPARAPPLCGSGTRAGTARPSTLIPAAPPRASRPSARARRAPTARPEHAAVPILAPDQGRGAGARLPSPFPSLAPRMHAKNDADRTMFPPPPQYPPPRRGKKFIVASSCPCSLIHCFCACCSCTGQIASHAIKVPGHARSQLPRLGDEDGVHGLVLEPRP